MTENTLVVSEFGEKQWYINSYILIFLDIFFEVIFKDFNLITILIKSNLPIKKLIMSDYEQH